MSPGNSRPTRRRLDAEERRDAILGAARRLFARAPFSEVSVAQVAEASGSSSALVFHYFGSKAGLYAAQLSSALDELVRAQTEANDRLPPGTSARDRVRAALELHLDHVSTNTAKWIAPFTGGDQPAEAQQARREARAAEVEWLRALLPETDSARREAALWGYFGFIDGACLHWVSNGCPAEQRYPLIDAALGALEGALGDWGA